MSTDLVIAATVGTTRRSVDPDHLPPALRPPQAADEASVAVLDAAALLALTRRSRAPQAPPGDPVAAVTAPVEHRPVVPAVVGSAVTRLRVVETVLIEALTLIDRAGLRLAPEFLPHLLADSRPAVVTATHRVSGEIGRLLVAVNPRWAPTAQPDPHDPRPWNEGSLLERTTWLRARRAVDPDGARALLQDGFTREPAANRVELLAALSVNLGPGDQDLLLAAVGDRSRAVGAAAVELLTRLPDSPLRRDMRALAARHLVLRRRLLRHPAITLTDPSAAEFAPWPAPDRDPWTPLLGRIDPAEWPTVFGADLLGLVGSTELQPLRPGFRRAAMTFRHPELAHTLVRHQIAAAANGGPTPVVDAALWAVLDPADLTDCFDRLLADHRVRPGHVGPLLDALDRPWPTAVARRLGPWLATSGTVGIPAARPLWEAWAAGTALADCREIAAVARQITERATGDQAATLVTRISSAANILTLRAVLHDALGRPEGSP